MQAELPSGYQGHETAAAHMVLSIPRAFADTPVAQVLQELRGQRFECADTLFVTDREGRLQGLVRIDDLFAAEHQRIDEVMEPESAAVAPGDDQEIIAQVAMAMEMIAVPVVDGSGHLLGAVPPEALLRILRQEHMEDLQRIAGIRPHREGPDVALDAPLLDRFRRRMPWLVTGLLASSLITLVMAGFQATLEANVAVAFFVPALVYIAGAIGTQAVSVAVRGLAGDTVQIGALLRDELAIGLAVGASLGAIAWLAVVSIFDDGMLAIAVGGSVLVGGAMSAVVGFLLPWGFERAGLDPALGSGPMCTIIQDVVSLFVYFLLVSALIL